MVKRIQQVVSLLLALLLLCGTALATDNSNNYTSPYYSDTQNLEENIVIDRLYEYGLMDGIIAPQKEELGVFGPNDVVTNQYFYTVMNYVIGSDLSTKSKGVITHQQAILIFKRMAKSCGYATTSCEYKFPQNDEKELTRAEMAKWIYSFAYVNLFTEGEKIAEKAFEYLGSNYAWGGTGPHSFDCSGFTYYIMGLFGHSIGRDCDAQYLDGERIEYENLRPGDIVLFAGTYASGGMTHAGIYIGNSKFIHAANSRSGVIITNLNDEYYYSHFVCGRRIVN